VGGFLGSDRSKGCTDSYDDVGRIKKYTKIKKATSAQCWLRLSAVKSATERVKIEQSCQAERYVAIASKQLKHVSL
jgi:hypothetical protein